MKIGPAILEIGLCSRTDRHTDRQTDRNSPLPYRGGVNQSTRSRHGTRNLHQQSWCVAYTGTAHQNEIASHTLDMWATGFTVQNTFHRITNAMRYDAVLRLRDRMPNCLLRLFSNKTSGLSKREHETRSYRFGTGERPCNCPPLFAPASAWNIARPEEAHVYVTRRRRRSARSRLGP